MASIKYCKGHGWQRLAGEPVTVETARACDGCTVRELSA